MSFGFRSGSTPTRTDTKWVRWAKVLAYYQSRAGIDVRNNLTQTNPVRLVKVKILRSLTGVASSVVPAVVTLTGNSGQDSVTWTWNKEDPATGWSVQQSANGTSGWVEVELADPESRSSTGLTGLNYFRVVASGGGYSGTTSNVVFLSQ